MSFDFSTVGGKKSVLMGGDPNDPANHIWNFGVHPEPNGDTVIQDLYNSKPRLYSAFPNIQGRWDGKTVNHINAVLQNTNNDWSKVEELIQMQPRGTCGGRAGSATIDFVQHILIASGKRAKFHRASHAALYFLARKKYNMLGGRWTSENNDGVAQGAIPEALKAYGEVTREEIGDDNYYGDGSDDLACKLGAGLLPDIQEKILKLGADNICSEWIPVTSAQELADGIAAGGIGIGADAQGFTMQRDGKGFCRPSGTWQHYQTRVSVLGESDYGQKGFGYWQSWGKTTPDGPKLAGHPGNCFGVDWDTQDHVCRTGAWAVVFGFPLWDLQQGIIDIPWNF